MVKNIIKKKLIEKCLNFSIIIVIILIKLKIKTAYGKHTNLTDNKLCNFSHSTCGAMA